MKFRAVKTQQRNVNSYTFKLKVRKRIENYGTE